MELERDSSTGSLGVAVIGGLELRARHSSARSTPTRVHVPNMEGREGEADQVQRPVLVKTILPDGPAAVDGRLRCGDILLAVNGFSFDALTHAQVVLALKHAPSPVQLTVVSWPATIL